MHTPTCFVPLSQSRFIPSIGKSCMSSSVGVECGEVELPRGTGYIVSYIPRYVPRHIPSYMLSNYLLWPD